MNLSEISERLSAIITDELDYSDEKKEIVAYGIESLFLALIGFLAVFLVAFLFKAIFPAAIAAVFGGFLRKLSGGAHFNTPIKCLTLGAVVYSLIGVLTKEIINYNLYNTNLLLLFLLLALILVVVFAPVDSVSKPIHSSSFRRKLKLASIAFVTFTFVLVLLSNNHLLNASAAMGVGYQTLTLLPVFNKKKKEG